MSRELDYLGPKRGRRIGRLFRGLATVLAAIATIWSLFSIILVGIGTWYGDVILLPGFVVTAGYWWRATRPPHWRWCRAIWGLSALVQGAWLVALLFLVVHGGSFPSLKDLYDSSLIVPFWWGASSLISIAGVILDRGSDPQQEF
jgi:hypothetical protein